VVSRLVLWNMVIINNTSALKNWEFSTRVGTMVDGKKVLKQAGVVYDIKSENQLKLLYPYTMHVIPKRKCTVGIYNSFN